MIWAFDSSGKATELCSVDDMAKIGSTGQNLIIANTKHQGEEVAMPTVLSMVEIQNGARQVASARKNWNKGLVYASVADLGEGTTGEIAFFNSRIFGTMYDTLWSYELKTGELVNPRSSQYDFDINGLMVTAEAAYGTGKYQSGTKGGVFKFSGASNEFKTFNSKIGQAVFSSSGKLIAGDVKSQLFFYKSDFSEELPEAVPIDESVKYSPALGDDGTIYLSGYKILARDSAGGAIWELEGEGSHGRVRPFSSAPALDCARDAEGKVVDKPGTLYVGSDDGKVYAIIVDSQGIDTAAPWPKYHRDPRNNANGDGDLSRFSCKTHVGKYLE